MADEPVVNEEKDEAAPAAEAFGAGTAEAPADDTERQLDQALAGIWSPESRESIGKILASGAEASMTELAGAIEAGEKLVIDDAAGIAVDDVQAFQARQKERLQKGAQAKAAAEAEWGALLDSLAEGLTKDKNVPTLEALAKPGAEKAAAEAGQKEKLDAGLAELLALEKEEGVPSLAALARPSERTATEAALKGVKEAAVSELIDVAKATEKEAMEEAWKKLENPDWTAEQWKQDAEGAAKNLEEVQSLRDAWEARKDSLNAAERAYLDYAAVYIDLETMQKQYAEARQAMLEKKEAIGGSTAGVKELTDMMTAAEALRAKRDAAASTEAEARKTYEAALAAFQTASLEAAAASVAATNASLAEKSRSDATAPATEPPVEQSARIKTSRMETAIGVGAMPVSAALEVGAGLYEVSRGVSKLAELLDWASKKLGRPEWLGWLTRKARHLQEKGFKKEDEKRRREGLVSETEYEKTKMTKAEFDAWKHKNDLREEWAAENLVLTDKGTIEAPGDLDLSEMDPDMKKLPKEIGDIEGDVVLRKDQTALASDAKKRGFHVRIIEG